MGFLPIVSYISLFYDPLKLFWGSTTFLDHLSSLVLDSLEFFYSPSVDRDVTNELLM